MVYGRKLLEQENENNKPENQRPSNFTTPTGNFKELYVDSRAKSVEMSLDVSNIQLNDLDG